LVEKPPRLRPSAWAGWPPPPCFFFRAGGVLVSADDGAVEEGRGQVGQVGAGALEQGPPAAGPFPAAEALVDGVPVAEGLGQVAPGLAGAGQVQHGLDEGAVVLRGRRAAARLDLGQYGGDAPPGGVGQNEADPLSGWLLVGGRQMGVFHNPLYPFVLNSSTRPRAFSFFM